MKNIILFTTIILLTSCKANEYLPNPSEYQNHMKGAHIECTIIEGKIDGEIIALNESEIYVLGTDEYSNQKFIIQKGDILEAKIMVVNKSDKLKTMKTIGVLNYLSTLGHGFAMLLSLPINLILNTGVISSAAGYNYIPYPDNISWDEMNKFSRFPQGISPDISLEDIE